jgi:hypothetical protein
MYNSEKTPVLTHFDSVSNIMRKSRIKGGLSAASVQAVLIYDTPGAIKILDGQSGHAQVASKAALQALAAQAATDSASGSGSSSPARYYTIVLRGGFCDCEEQSGLLCKHIRAVAR